MCKSKDRQHNDQKKDRQHNVQKKKEKRTMVYKTIHIKLFDLDY